MKKELPPLDGGNAENPQFPNGFICDHCRQELVLRHQNYSITVTIEKAWYMMPVSQIHDVSVDGNYCNFNMLWPQKDSPFTPIRIKHSLDGLKFLSVYGLERVSRSHILNLLLVTSWDKDNLYTRYSPKGFSIGKTYEETMYEAMLKFYGMEGHQKP